MNKKNLVGGIVLLSIIIYIIILNLDHDDELKKKGRYTIGTTIKFTLSTSGRDVIYEFFVDDKRYESFSRYYYSAKVPNGKYLVKFSSEDPSINEIYLNKPLSENLIPPKLGWKNINDIR